MASQKVPMDERARFDALLGLLEELVEANDERPILVEGQRDVASLRALGCRGRLLTIHSGDPLVDVAERVAASTTDVILLTDWDRKGDRFFEEFTATLSRHGVRCDRSFRDRIPAYARAAFKDVESLAPFVRRGLQKWHQRDLDEHAQSLAEDLDDVAAKLAAEFPHKPVERVGKHRWK
jgi:5S rRNA maturation endonuclease (ribonuclease M5)